MSEIEVEETLNNKKNNENLIDNTEIIEDNKIYSNNIENKANDFVDENNIKESLIKISEDLDLLHPNEATEIIQETFDTHEKGLLLDVTNISKTLEKQNLNTLNICTDPSYNINKLEKSNTHETKFYDNLRTVIKTQENILTMTSMAKEKIKYANEISVDQLKCFKDHSMKYGKYLKLIHEELLIVGDLMKKIKKEIK